MRTARTLTLASYPVQDLKLGGETALVGTSLTISPARVEALVLTDSRIQSVQVAVALPGSSTRIINVMDVVEPRCKPGLGAAFPGWLSAVAGTGQGRTHRLANMAVIATGRLLDDGDSFLSQQDAVIDMSGEGAAFSPFSRTCNLVLRFTLAPGLDPAGQDEAIRRATLKVARELAAVTLELPPAEEVTYTLPETDGNLPRVVHMCELTTFGRYFDTSLYGVSTQNIFPTLLHPFDFFDGALVSGDYHYAGQRNPTYWYQNNPVAKELLARHGQDLHFAGCVLFPVCPDDPSKERSARHAARLAELLQADGAVVTAAAAGNAHIDVMFVTRACEQIGIRTAVVQVEMSGPSGEDPALVDFVPEADLIISTGNREQIIRVGPVEQLLGGERWLRGDGDPRHGAALPMRDICGSNNELGAEKLTAQVF